MSSPGKNTPGRDTRRPAQRGACPVCGADGQVGAACPSAGCSARALHFIPTEYCCEPRTSPVDLDPLIGRMLGDHLVVGPLGRGGFGSVYVSVQLPIGMKTALKVLHSHLLQKWRSGADTERFEREAAALAMLSHPNIVRLIKYGVVQDMPYMVTELVAGGRPLSDVMARRKVARACVPVSEVRHVSEQLLNALAAAHSQGIVHRDIKPQNIMLQAVEGDPCFVRVLDFGLAKLVGEGRDTTQIQGTPLYMAPEQYSGRDIGPWTDLYSAALVVLEMLTGRPLYACATPMEVLLKKTDRTYDPLAAFEGTLVPRDAAGFFRRAVSVDPGARYRDTASFRAELMPVLDRWPQPSGPEPLTPHTFSGQPTAAPGTARSADVLVASSSALTVTASSFPEMPGRPQSPSATEIAQRKLSSLLRWAVATPRRVPALKWGLLAMGLAVAVGIGAVAGGLWSPASHQGDLQLSQETEGLQMFPAWARAGNDGLVAVWESTLSEGTRGDVVGRVFSVRGEPLGDEFLVSSFAGSYKTCTTAVGCPDGRVLVLWLSEGQDGSGWGLYAQWLSPAGERIRQEFLVNADHPQGDQELGAAACLPSNDSLVVWQSYGEDGDQFGVVAQRFHEDGSRDGRSFLVNTETAGRQRYPTVAAASNGNALVAWETDRIEGKDDFGIMAQVFAQTGARVGRTFEVNTHTVGRQRYPAAAPHGDRGFIVAWTSEGQDGSGRGVFAQLIDVHGLRIGEEFQINENTDGDQWLPRVASLADGRFLATWMGQDADDSSLGVFARVFDSQGIPSGPDVCLHRETTGDQRVRSVVALGTTTFAVSWESAEQDGDGWGVFGRIIDIDSTLVAR